MRYYSYQLPFKNSMASDDWEGLRQYLAVATPTERAVRAVVFVASSVCSAAGYHLGHSAPQAFYSSYPGELADIDFSFSAKLRWRAPETAAPLSLSCCCRCCRIFAATVAGWWQPRQRFAGSGSLPSTPAVRGGRRLMSSDRACPQRGASRLRPVD